MTDHWNWDEHIVILHLNFYSFEVDSEQDCDQKERQRDANVCRKCSLYNIKYNYLVYYIVEPYS